MMSLETSNSRAFIVHAHHLQQLIHLSHTSILEGSTALHSIKGEICHFSAGFEGISRPIPFPLLLHSAIQPITTIIVLRLLKLIRGICADSTCCTAIDLETTSQIPAPTHLQQVHPPALLTTRTQFLCTRSQLCQQSRTLYYSNRR